MLKELVFHRLVALSTRSHQRGPPVLRIEAPRGRARQHGRARDHTRAATRTRGARRAPGQGRERTLAVASIAAPCWIIAPRISILLSASFFAA